MPKLSAITSDNPILLVGCGKMGSAMLSGWLKRKLDGAAIHIVDPNIEHVKAEFKNFDDRQLHNSFETISRKIKPSFIILAVKPQMMDDVMEALKINRVSGDVIVSVAAGRTIRYFEDHISRDQAIIRAMPNTPAAIGRGITVCCANRLVSVDKREVCTLLLQAVGMVEWIEDESLMDAVTALSGSGPAYVFAMVEAMASAGEAIGLDPELSRRLARETVCGSGALLDQSKELASKLRENVTSPGGTTAAALDVLMADDGIFRIMRRAMQDAKARSKELAGS
ncbi:MAG: pyrroline-5-carboxylate reductase [Alphaproteobacteria bacterium]|nr:pyrroline-5-carboxylate reductase [Alphaproteobacteria bacterium]HPF47887.1 pyrroline-5-carboxylate reductase [Emcibacteraceae bacterium]